MTMTMTPSAVPTGRLDIGRVGRETFDIIKTDPIGTYGLAVGLGLIPMLLTILLTAAGVVHRATPGNPFAAFGVGFLITMIIGLVVGVLIFGTLGYGAVERLQGRSPTIGQRLSASGAALLPMIGVGILAYFGIVIGMFFLIVPGVFLATMWLLVLVAAVVDRTGVFASFSRSAALTQNHRWMIFALMVIYGVIVILIGLVQLVLMRLFLGAGPVGVVIITSLIGLIIGGAVNAIGATGVGVVYQELRRAKGEFDPGRLAEVFS